MSNPPSDHDRKLDNLPSIALREAWLWGQAVHRLARAIEASTDDVSAQVDAMLLAVAYRNVHRSANWAVRHLPEDRAELLRAAIHEADARVPDARKVRDMLEHFDEYEEGRGRLQHPNGLGSRQPNERLALEHRVYFKRGETFVLVVAGRELATSEVQLSTRQLIRAIHEYTAGS